jgi:hypothetical protein
MYNWRITKYNPAYRDKSGCYLKDEWTSISDIGNIYDRKVLTYETYRKVEDAYVLSALKFWSESGNNPLIVAYLENSRILNYGANDLRDIDLDPRLVRIGIALDDKALDNICRLVLREVIWCKLESKNGGYIHFGYDYYMYIGSHLLSEESIDRVSDLGLFVEEISESPYLNAGKVE